jgi:hypothetical protein
MTAVEFFIQQILKHDKSFIEFYNAEIQQALEMEKKQIKDACNYGDFEELGEKYYYETFKKP